MIFRNTHGIPAFRNCYVLIIFAFLLSVKQGFSQAGSLIDLDSVKQRKVRKYIISRDIDKLTDFSSLQPSWNKNSVESDFNSDKSTFIFNDRISRVWDNYRFADPLRSWKGRFVRISFLISKRSKSVHYPATTNGLVLDTGQVYFLNLRLIEGLYKVPVAFEIINIDPDDRIIEYSYIDGNIEKGKQIIQLFNMGEDLTQVVHTSYFKSESPLRDKFIYPFFHKRIVRDFHKKMKRQDNRKKRENRC